MVVLRDQETGPFYFGELMFIPDYDDYYSLTEYASRFSTNPMKLVAGWISQVSTLSIIELWERSHENDGFRGSLMETYINKVEEDDILDPMEVIPALGLGGLTVSENSIVGSVELYYDFVMYITAQGINTR